MPLAGGLDGDAAVGVLLEAGVEDRVAELVAQLVGVAVRDELGGRAAGEGRWLVAELHGTSPFVPGRTPCRTARKGGALRLPKRRRPRPPRHQESGVSAGHPLVRSARCSVLTASLPLGGKAPWASVPGCRALLRRATLDAGSMLGRRGTGVKGGVVKTSKDPHTPWRTMTVLDDCSTRRLRSGQVDPRPKDRTKANLRTWTSGDLPPVRPPLDDAAVAPHVAVVTRE